MRQCFDELKIHTRGHSMHLITQAVGETVQHRAVFNREFANCPVYIHQHRLLCRKMRRWMCRPIY